MAIHFITTCGTSIRGRIERSDLDKQDNIIGKRIMELSAKSDFLAKLSAETNSLQALKATKDDQVTLIVTDTNDGLICAKHLQKVISKYFGCSVDIEVIKYLQVKNPTNFRSRGISNLFEAIAKVKNRYFMETVLNVTGGFKSVIPYMALYGLFYQLEMVYLFEFSDHIIKLPPAPLGVDFEKAASISDFLIKLKKESYLESTVFENALEKTPFNNRSWLRSLVCEEEGFVYLSAFGQIVVDKADEETLPVLISENAGKQLNSSSGAAQKRLQIILNKIGDPLWRESHLDPGWNSIDLLVAKPGNTAERAAFYIKKGTIYICELYTDHDRYERHLPNRKLSDYGKEVFSEYNSVSDPTLEFYEFDSDLDHKNAKLASKCEQLSKDLADSRIQLKAKAMAEKTNVQLKEQTKKLNNEVMEQKKITENLEQACERSQEELKELMKYKETVTKNSLTFRKRLSFLFKGYSGKD